MPSSSRASLQPQIGALSLSTGSGIVAERMAPALTQRTWTINGSQPRRRCHLFLILRGEASFRCDENPEIDLTAPALLWLPRTARGAFCLPAGSDGVMLSIAEELVWRAVGDNPVAQDLRVLLDRVAIGPAERVAPCLPELSTVMGAILRETRDQLPGAAAMLGLNIGLMLLHLWRASGSVSTAGQRGTGSATFQVFQLLVEIHYRENLTIDEFAALLGVSRGHLHEACLRGCGRTPLSIVHQRQIDEAKLRLEQTQLSVEQLSYGLGFRDPGYFSRFFKRLTGETPGAYRQRMAHRPASDAASFAAWP